MSPVEMKNTSVHTGLSDWADDRNTNELTVGDAVLEATDHEYYDRDPE